jgi:hypothetical protein
LIDCCWATGRTATDNLAVVVASGTVTVGGQPLLSQSVADLSLDFV